MPVRDSRLFFAVFVLAAVLANPVYAYNENRSLDLASAICHGRLSIDPDADNTMDRAFYARRIPAASVAVGEPTPASQLRSAHYYSGGAPGFGVALVPFYAVARLFPRLMTSLLVLAGAALPLALGALGVRRAVVGLFPEDPAAATTAALAYALGTNAFVYGTRLFAHSLVLALLAWSAALALGGSRPRGALAGLLAALAVTCDYNAAPGAAALGLLVLLKGGLRPALAFAAGTVVPAVALGAYHQACFDSPFATPYDHHDAPLARQYVAHGSYGFTWPRPWIALELLVGLRHGVLWTQPLVLLGFAGLAAGARQSRLVAVVLGAALVAFASNASRVNDWHGGPTFGTRYAVNALPFVALGLPRGLALLGRAGPWVAAWSALVQVVGAVTEFRFSFPANVELLVVHAPRMRAVNTLLGADLFAVDVRTNAVAALVLSLAVLAAFHLLRPRTDLAWKLAAALAAWLLFLPFFAILFLRGPSGIERARTSVLAREYVRNARYEDAPDEVRRLLASVETLAPNELGARLAVLDRLCELDPADRAASVERARLRVLLAR